MRGSIDRLKTCYGFGEDRQEGEDGVRGGEGERARQPASEKRARVIGNRCSRRPGARGLQKDARGVLRSRHFVFLDFLVVSSFSVNRHDE